MTLSCPSETCPMCTGAWCNACGVHSHSTDGFTVDCGHTVEERHESRDVMPDVHVPQPLLPESFPTKRVPAIIESQTLTIDLADADQLASFLELVARIARARGRITVTVR